MKSPKIPGRCLACGSRLSEPLFILDNMPVGAQAMPEKEELSKDRGVSLPLCRCEKCSLVQFDCEPVDYYRDAIRVAGLSETMQDLRRKDYQHLIDKYGLEEKKWLECGCGNGDFLKTLMEFPVEIYGTEAGDENVIEAGDKLLKTADRHAEKKTEHDIHEKADYKYKATFKKENIVKFFPESSDMKIPGSPFDCFLSFNFLEHQPDPRSMLGCIWNNLSDDGIGLITVPSFEYILDKRHYYELIRDHIANYDMKSLERLVNSCGFKVLEKDFTGIGDTIRMVVQKKEKPFDIPYGKINIDQNKKEDALRLNYLEMKKEIEGYMAELKKKNRSIALWGASHQGFTIAATTALKEHASYIIDSSEKKYGRFAPASHLPIVPPEAYLKEPVDVIMIAAPGYIKEIEKTIRERYDCKNGPGVPAICDILDMRER